MKKFLLVIPLLFTLGACASLSADWAIITGTTALGIVAVRAKVPAGYYRLLSSSGTVTDAIVGQYLEAA